MKALLIGMLVLGTSSVFAQTLTKAQVATLLQSKKAILEAVNVGMSKSSVTTSAVVLEDGTKCAYKKTAVQSILKIEVDKMIVLSKEQFQPAVNAACTAAGIEAFEESILFYEAKPSLDADLEDLNASDTKTILRAGDILAMDVTGTITNDDGTTSTELMTVKYDLTKSSFKNLFSIMTPSSLTVTTDVTDIDVNTVDLHDVSFCDSSDSAKEDCVRGDFSDILF